MKIKVNKAVKSLDVKAWAMRDGNGGYSEVWIPDEDDDYRFIRLSEYGAEVAAQDEVPFKDCDCIHSGESITITF